MDFTCSSEWDDSKAGKAIGERFDRDAIDGTTMMKLAVLMTTATVLMSAATTAALAQDDGGRPLRFGNTSGWYFDGRGDSRDFPTNGVFPGNFAVDPASAAIGAAGIFGSTPWRSAMPYPSQVTFGCRPLHRVQKTFLENDSGRRRCW
jgi:hypothetical protein